MLLNTASVVTMLSGAALVMSAPATSSSPDYSKMVLHEQVPMPASVHSVGVPKSNQMIDLEFHLVHNNITGLKQRLFTELANPKHKNYGKWLKHNETAKYLTPSFTAVFEVSAWLAHNNITNTTMGGKWNNVLKVSLPAAGAAKLLQASFQMLAPKNGAAAAAPRALNYSVPVAVVNHINSIQPISNLWHAASAKALGGVKAPANVTTKSNASHHKRSGECGPNDVDPTCLWAEYYVDYECGDQAATAIYLPDSANHNDAQYWSQIIGKTGKYGDFGDIWLTGNQQSGDANDEGNIDVQWAMSMSRGCPVYAVYPDPNSSDSIADFAQFLGSDSAPKSASLSYLLDERYEGGYSAVRTCDYFCAAAAQGVSVFVASGDWGCDGVGNDGSQSCSSFVPSFPSTCPCVTSVGATQFNRDDTFTPHNSGSPDEIVAMWGDYVGTGGGFSNIFVRPDWQNDAVQNYINELGSNYDGLYNKNGRAYPDVMALGKNMLFVQNGQLTQGYYGSSFSAPIWAGMTTLINDYRISQGKGTVGFLNPYIYGSGNSMFFDTVSGGTRGCYSFGLYAQNGWDAASGWGSPIFTGLRQNMP